MLGQLVEVNGWGDGGAGEPLVVGIVAPGFVLINLVVLLPPRLATSITSSHLQSIH